ncbi:MAG: hypothetical protein ABI610_13845, partial [Acidobacteriota bacterium]
MRRLLFLAFFAAAARCLAQDSRPAPRPGIQEYTIDPGALPGALPAAAARCLAQDSRPAARPGIQEYTIDPGALRFERIVLTPIGVAKPVPAELGRLTVLENRARPDGATIELAFVRLKTSASRPGPPVVWLAGGPGGSGTEDTQGPLYPLLRDIAEFSDVIALDQRGMGLSRPRLDCPGRLDLPLDRPMEPGLVL